MQHLIPEFEFCVFDLETTGMSPHRGAEIIEVGGVLIRGGDLAEEFQAYVKPEKSIPGKVQKLTGITPEDVQDAPPVKQVLRDFLDFVADSYLVAHNISFDRPFVEYYAPREILNDDLDTLKIARQVCSFRSNKLGAIADELGVDLSDAHRAIHDARATAEIFLEISKNIREPRHYRACDIPEEIREKDSGVKTPQFSETEGITGFLGEFGDWFIQDRD